MDIYYGGNDLNESTEKSASKTERAEESNKRTRQHLNSAANGNVIDWSRLNKISPDLANWLQSIVKGDSVNFHVLTNWHPDYNRVRCFLYTHENKYTITAIIPNKHKPKGYLAAGFSRRKPYAGEDWTRGGDLKDGNFSKETFDMIVRDIVATELISFRTFKQNE